jgi:hypothetical protein
MNYVTPYRDRLTDRDYFANARRWQKQERRAAYTRSYTNRSGRWTDRSAQLARRSLSYMTRDSGRRYQAALKDFSAASLGITPEQYKEAQECAEVLMEHENPGKKAKAVPGEWIGVPLSIPARMRAERMLSIVGRKKKEHEEYMMKARRATEQIANGQIPDDPAAAYAASLLTPEQLVENNNGLPTN